MRGPFSFGGWVDVIRFMFEVGDKVVCIDGKFPLLVAKLYTALPREGVTYVVREINLGVRLDCKTGDLSVLLVGIVNPLNEDTRAKKERGFSETRFRKLEELKDLAKTRKVEPEVAWTTEPGLVTVNVAFTYESNAE